jgi:WXG100 family type VII secretion target
MADIHVDYEALRSTASRLTAGQHEMESQLTQLKGLVDSLVSSGFVTDQASGKFHQSYEQWNSGTRNAIEGLQGMSSFLTTAINQHEQLDSSLSQSVGG